MKWKGTSNLRSGNGCWTISWRALSIKDVPQSLAATSHWTLDWTLEMWTCRDSCDFVQAAIPEEMTAFESFQSTDAVLQDINGLAIARAKRAGLPWFTKVEVTICSNPAGAQTQNDNGTRWIFRFAWNPFVLRSASKRMSLKIKTRDINGHLGPRWRCRGRSNQEMWGKGGEKYASSQVLVWKRADRDFRCKIGSVILLQVVFAPLDSEGSAPRMLMRPAVYFIFQYISTMSYSFQTISMLFYSWKTRTQVGHGLQAWHWVRKWLDALVSSRHCWLDCYFWRCNHWIITEHCHNWSPAQVRAMFTGGMPPGGRLPGFWLSVGMPNEWHEGHWKMELYFDLVRGVWTFFRAQAWLKNNQEHAYIAMLHGEVFYLQQHPGLTARLFNGSRKSAALPKINKAPPWACHLSWGTKHCAGLQRLSKFWVLSLIKGTMLCQILKDYKIIREASMLCEMKWLACKHSLWAFAWWSLFDELGDHVTFMSLVFFRFISLHFWYVGWFHSSEACQWLNDSGKGGDKVPVEAFSIDCRPYQPGTWTETELFDRPLEQKEP